MKNRLSYLPAAWIWIASVSVTFAGEPLTTPSYDAHTRGDAVRFDRQAKEALAPVYPYLAEYIVERYQLADRPGIGIDLGSGPGDVIVELARRTRSMYWVNADINPHCFQSFCRDVGKAELSHRVGAVFADAGNLPFRDGYADIVISRGSFQFWGDTARAFGEILRVLKPGGHAFIGRGLSPNTPLEVARAVREKQNGGPQYDLDETEALFRRLMSDLGIRSFEIVRPRPGDEVNYGIWVAFTRTPGAADDD